MRILIITYYWPPAGGPGVQRWLKMVKYLLNFDVEPIVLTVDPSNATYPVEDNSLLNEVPNSLKVVRTKSWEPLNIYGRLFGRKRIPYSGFTNVNKSSLQSKLSRWIRGNFFLPDARIGWNKYALKEAQRILQQEEIDFIITTGPPHSTHLIGLELKKEFETPWIADFRDPWTDIYYYDDFLHTKRNKLKDRKLETEVLNSSDIVLSVCPSNVHLFQEKLLPTNRGKIHLITNGYDPDDFHGLSNPNDPDRFRIAYTGTIADVYRAEPILKILKQIPFEWTLIMAGSITDKFKSAIEEEGLRDKIELLGYVSHKESLEIISSANLLLHILPDTEKSKFGTTGKLFEYIGSGTPIINFGPKSGDAALFIESSNSGKTFEREEIKEAIEFISGIASKEHESSTNRGQFSRKTITKDLVQLLRSYKSE